MPQCTCNGRCTLQVQLRCRHVPATLPLALHTIVQHSLIQKRRQTCSINANSCTPCNHAQVYTAVEDCSAAMSQLRSLGLTVDGEASELVYRAQAEVEVDDDAFAKCEALVERLLDLDDVDAVYSNCEGMTA